MRRVQSRAFSLARLTRVIPVLLLIMAALPARALDRNAFTFTAYSLKVAVRPAEHGFQASGTIELRNDSGAPQTQVPLQISSSLAWNRIVFEGEPVAYIAQTYTSDIDHTGALEEAIVTLPRPVVPGASVKLEVSYAGEITRDFGRLTRIGTPKGIALNSDWDEVAERFSAVRGLGYVTWYPVSIEAVSLSDGNAVFDALARWKERHAHSAIRVTFTIAGPPTEQLSLVTSAQAETAQNAQAPEFSSSKGSRMAATEVKAEFSAGSTPVFVVGEFVKLESPALTIFHSPEQTAEAHNYADAAEHAERVLADLFGPLKRKPRVIALPEGNRFRSGTLLLTPLGPLPETARELAATRSLVDGSVRSSREWISEGLARFGQALVRERQAGRAAAQQFLAPILPALVEAEEPSVAGSGQRAESESLINTHDELLYSGKAAYVWWMLRDMLGDAALTKAIASYHPEQDTDPAYVQRLLEAQFTPRRDLEPFFDAWVYRDRGLPDFRVDAANARETLENSFVVSVTVENLTNVWAEVPVILRDASDHSREVRLQVAGKSKATTRITFQGMPTLAEVNDGSVPEMDFSNNKKEVQRPGQQQLETPKP